MELTIHVQVLGLVFLLALVFGAVVNKTNFCTMGAVSDWINIGDTGRMRAWVFAIAIALAGVLILETAGMVSVGNDTFPPYRTPAFAWLRYVLGGVMFGIGMTLASGCGNKTLIRVGGGNLKSIVVLAVAAFFAYLMLWTDFFNTFFMSWMQPTIINLTEYNIQSQGIGAIVGGLFGLEDIARTQLIVGAIIAVSLFIWAFKSSDFRGSFDNILGGAVVGLAIVAGWYVTGSEALGGAWKEYATFATEIPSRVETQSFTFISPMGDSVRYLMSPERLHLLNFGIMALTGVIVGSLLYALFSRSFRVEWFVNTRDFVAHAVGGVLMGVGGVLAMGCTIGQGVTGVSTLALGSVLAFFSIVFGSALTMKVQYYMLDEQGFFSAFRSSLADFKLLPAKKSA